MHETDIDRAALASWACLDDVVDRFKHSIFLVMCCYTGNLTTSYSSQCKEQHGIGAVCLDVLLVNYLPRHVVC